MSTHVGVSSRGCKRACDGSEICRRNETGMSACARDPVVSRAAVHRGFVVMPVAPSLSFAAISAAPGRHRRSAAALGVTVAIAAARPSSPRSATAALDEHGAARLAKLLRAAAWRRARRRPMRRRRVAWRKPARRAG